MPNSKVNDHRRVLNFINRHIERKGFPPTTREIKDALGYSSTSMVRLRLEVLVDKGMIEIEPKIARGIRVL